MNDRVIVFLKQPRPGHVKTRLAASIGLEKAVEVYEWLIELTLDAVKQTKCEVCHYWDEIPPQPLSADHFYLQNGSDLGDRLSNAFKEQMENSTGKLLVIGSDCPELKTSHLTEALQLLESADLVIGPAKDGGFYLLGSKTDVPDLWKNVRWSSSETLNDVLANARSLHLQTSFLETLQDLDLPEDFVKFEPMFLQRKSRQA